jgi:hypothetical protein
MQSDPIFDTMLPIKLHPALPIELLILLGAIGPMGCNDFVLGVFMDTILILVSPSSLFVF